MKVSDIMSRDVQIARPQDSIQSVAKRMREIDAGSMPICDGERVHGMVTDRDIAIRAVAEGRSFESPVSDIMSAEVECVFDDDDAREAAGRMASAQVRRLPVLNRETNLLVGILALGDIAGRVKDSTAGHALEEISEQTRPI